MKGVPLLYDRSFGLVLDEINSCTSMSFWRGKCPFLQPNYYSDSNSGIHFQASTNKLVMASKQNDLKCHIKVPQNNTEILAGHSKHYTS